MVAWMVMSVVMRSSGVQVRVFQCSKVECVGFVAISDNSKRKEQRTGQVNECLYLSGGPIVVDLALCSACPSCSHSTQGRRPPSSPPPTQTWPSYTDVDLLVSPSDQFPVYKRARHRTHRAGLFSQDVTVYPCFQFVDNTFPFDDLRHTCIPVRPSTFPFVHLPASVDIPVRPGMMCK